MASAVALTRRPRWPRISCLAALPQVSAWSSADLSLVTWTCRTVASTRPGSPGWAVLARKRAISAHSASLSPLAANRSEWSPGCSK